MEISNTHPTDAQNRQILSCLRSGEVFGEMAVLDSQPRSAWATAETNATVSFVPSEEILCLMEEYPELALKFLREISGRLRRVNQRQNQEAA